MTLEILIPVRNPTEVFDQTVESLTLQTEKNFSVLISDNFSTKGQEHIAAALEKLSAAGIAARKIQPPVELERVEHWNWAHYQSAADWLKPLFVGDWLEPGYTLAVQAVILREPRCTYIYCGFQYHRAEATRTVIQHWNGRFYTPEEMQDVVMRFGMQFGPPSAAAYERTAFVALGGYASTLPISADSLMFCTLAARFGATGIQETLVHFNIHAARFSTTLPGKQRDTYREALTCFFMLGYHAWTERDRFPVLGFLRLLARETKNYLVRK